MDNQIIELAILKLKKKTFTNDKGEVVPYNEIFVTLGSKNFPLFVAEKNKELFKYLINEILEEKGII